MKSRKADDNNNNKKKEFRKNGRKNFNVSFLHKFLIDFFRTLFLRYFYYYFFNLYILFKCWEWYVAQFFGWLLEKDASINPPVLLKCSLILNEIILWNDCEIPLWHLVIIMYEIFRNIVNIIYFQLHLWDVIFWL